MNRDIKFRFYSFNDEEMFHPKDITHIDFHTKYVRVDSNSYSGYYEFGEYGEGILMEYTGLKDKEGKDIYEGDIVRHKNPRPFISSIYEVIFLNGGFAIKKDDYIEDLHEFLKESSSAEVIGNKYKNPELLSKNYRVFI